ncbi:MAG: hypothetical protein KUG77_11335 [Nannocystaceae bacterium]|nr:hypothetical protein [Nannocystaceae bacterium]
MDLVSNTRNTRRLGALGLATLFAVLSGCFTEPSSGDTGATGATGGGCDEGSFGCECLAGSCEPELVCTPSNICIAENCAAGTSYCECEGPGLCGPGLECMSNVCFPQGSTTVMPTSSDSNSSSTGTSTTGTSTTTAPGTTSVDPDTSTTALDTTDAMESATTDPPEGCPDARETCADCFSCTHDNECGSEHADCDGEPGCLTISTCMQDCAVEGLCFDSCCDGVTAPARAAALALQLCREDTCIAGPCDSFSAFTCD